MSHAIFDLDGCVSDDRWRLKMIKENGPDRWDVYHANCVYDEPINTHFVKHHMSAGDAIMFLTARPEKHRDDTWAWISKHFGDNADYALYMRPDGDETPSPDLKIALLRQYGYKPTDITAAYDDRDDVLAAYRRWGVKLTTQLVARSTVPDILRGMAATYEERQKVYGKSYVQFGDVAAALWPDGIAARTPQEFSRLGVVVQIISKLTRYIGSDGHKDSAHDMAVYSAILEELTDEL